MKIAKIKRLKQEWHKIYDGIIFFTIKRLKQESRTHQTIKNGIKYTMAHATN